MSFIIDKLVNDMINKKSIVCVGLDPRNNKRAEESWQMVWLMYGTIRS